MIDPGTLLGPFDIIAPLGAGGMGEVYRARDTRLNRTVALKVLPALKASREFRRRFDREARAIAGLNHPHICTLHDVRHEAGLDILVMEYCEGMTLAERLKRGALPVDQVVRYGTEIAAALDHAHRHGLTHRDLKPGNIMLTPAGAKLLDFGLAKLHERDATELAAPTGVTEAFDVTVAGTVVGTRQYMAPEQLEDKPVDERADTFAFGAVLYEMLTGRRAFEANSQIGLIAAILSSEPLPIATLQPLAPPALRRVIKHCLAKNPDDRWSRMHDVLLELNGITEDLSAAASEAVRKPRRLPAALMWLLAGLVTLLVGGLAWRAASRPAAESVSPSVSRFPVFAPETATLASLDGLIVSPDGRRFTFVASLADGKPLLWVRLRDALSAQPLSGTEGASHPFWSPDSRFVGFFADGKLKTIEVSGGPPETVCDAPFGRSGTWSERGVILFARSGRDPLFSVSAAGGVPAQATTLDSARGDWGHRTPHFLPGGQQFLYVVRSTQSQRQGVYVGTLGGGQGPRLLSGDSSAIFARPGYVLYVDGATLMARPFDLGRLQMAGEPFAVAHPVGYDVTTGRAFFSVSDDGVLTYRGGGDPNMQLTWFDRRGTRLATVGPPGQYWDLSLSPDDKRIAVTRMDTLLGARDIWVVDAVRGTASQLTFDPENDLAPAWSPDGARITFYSTRNRTKTLFQKPSTGAGPEETLVQSASEMFSTDWSRDGRYLVFSHIDPSTTTRSDLWLLTLGDRQIRPFLVTPFRETHARFSPDGRWLAYSSDESGRPEVYVRSVSSPDSKWAVSTEGGAYPTWRRDGLELFYLDPEGTLNAVDLTPGPAFHAAAPHALFQTGLGQVSTSGAGADYAFTSDGQRVLLKTALQSADASQVTVVLNWTQGAGK
jgi:serine/threonine protein kinase/Tol biopolymer transport system component